MRFVLAGWSAVAAESRGEWGAGSKRRTAAAFGREIMGSRLGVHCWTEALAPIQHWTGNHDVGFMINCSYGNGLRLTGNKDYEAVLIQTADSLCQRYSPVTKCLESWDQRDAWDGTHWDYPVIIDNMMNLELLFEASRLSGNRKYYDIAVQHARTTMSEHYRDDYFCYHVVDFDPETGKVLDKATCQGFTDESSWARGQAWGLYGFCICYRFYCRPIHT